MSSNTLSSLLKYRFTKQAKAKLNSESSSTCSNDSCSSTPQSVSDDSTVPSNSHSSPAKTATGFAMSSCTINGLIKYRFTRLDNADAGEASLNSSNNSTFNGDTQNASGENAVSSNVVSSIPDTPEANRPEPDSPVFPAGVKPTAVSCNSEVWSQSSDSCVSASAPSSPWLTTQKPRHAIENGTAKLKTNRNRIMSDSDSEDKPDSTTQDTSDEVNFQSRLRHLRTLFPTQSKEELELAVRSTHDLDSAIDAAMGIGREKMQPPSKARKRIRTVSTDSSDSDGNIHPASKKARPIHCSQDSSQHVAEDNTEHIDQVEGLQDKVDFLSEAFPKVPKECLKVVLRRNNYDVEDSSVDISNGNFTMITTVTDESNGSASGLVSAGSIKAIQAERAQARMKKGTSTPSTTHAEDSDEEVMPQAKTKVRKAPSDACSLSDIDENDLEEDYDSDDSESEMMSSDQTKILSFFNTATIEELQTMPGSAKRKAETMMDLRPFKSWQELVEKVEESKLLSFNMISGCREMIRIRAVVMQLMQKCEKISREMQQIVRELVEGERLDEGHITQQPKMLSESLVLKPFQMVGLNWLMLMHRQELNGILADEMGLGKTVQSISFLAQITQEGEEGPHIVICPSSTLDNWLSELRCWCPDLKVSMYYGSQEERREIRTGMMDGSEDCQVIVTTYNMATGSTEDRVFLKKQRFHYAIFDEAHMLKNMSSLRYQNLMKIRAERRILLTGTPLQNNLVELMSLLCFVMPDMFSGKTEHLKKLFSTITQKPKSKDSRSSYERDVITRAKNIMKPFVLRRLKSEVLQQLPKKIDHEENCEMTPVQQELYCELKEKFQSNLELNEELRNPSIGSGASMLMQLRKAANHHLLHRREYSTEKLCKMSKLMLKEPSHCEANPDLIFEDMEVMSDFELHKLCKNFKSLSKYKLEEEQIMNTGKFRFLDQLLPKLKENGDRVLLFSQFTMMLDILEDYMKSRKHRYFRLDGQTAVVDRQDMINRYNADESVFMFLLSTRAGGLGINLTSANTVILHDLDFNPYNDKQAEDRCHRVGQTRDVTVYRLISKNSVEEAILKCAQGKLKLEQDITSKPSKIKKEDGDEDVEPSDVAFLLREALV